MTPTKLLIGQIFAAFAIVILGVWAATQWAADLLAYQSQLGPAWFEVLGRPVYRPWQLFGWWCHYEAYAPAVFDKADLLAGTSGFLGCAGAIVGSLWRARQTHRVTTYGSSRWASVGEVSRAGSSATAAPFSVVHDIKGENWMLTAGWRSRFSHCLLFNPPIRARPATIRCWKFARAPTRSATFRISPTSWSIRM